MHVKCFEEKSTHDRKLPKKLFFEVHYESLYFYFIRKLFSISLKVVRTLVNVLEMVAVTCKSDIFSQGYMSTPLADISSPHKSFCSSEHLLLRFRTIIKRLEILLQESKNQYGTKIS